MQSAAPYASLTSQQFDAIVSAEMGRLATLAAQFGAEAVGRDYPTHKTRAGGYRYAVSGKWYVVRNGERQPATASQARALNAAYETGGYGSIGPVKAAK